MDEALIETGISSENIFDGNLLHVRRDTVKLPNGKTATREWIKHPGASSVIPMLEDGSVILVKQYRYPVGKMIRYRKKVDTDTPTEKNTRAGSYFSKTDVTLATTVGFSNEYIHLYIATGLHSGKQHTDDDEFINVVKVPLQEAVAMVNDGRIIDAKSVVSILMAAARQA